MHKRKSGDVCVYMCSCHSLRHAIFVHFPLQNLLESKPVSKRDTLRDLEKKVQEKWEQKKIFEIDAPKVNVTQFKLDFFVIIGLRKRIMVSMEANIS